MTIEPPTYSALELDVMRGLFGLSVLLSLDVLKLFRPKGDQSRPVGLARRLDLRWLEPRRQLFHGLAQLSVVAYMVDVGTSWALAYLTAFLVLHVTAASSAGSVNHGHHMVTIVAVAQTCAVLVWNATEALDGDVEDWLGASRGAAAAWWSVQVIVALYLTSGLTKVIDTGGRWIRESPGLLVSATSRLETAGAMGGHAQLRIAQRAQRMIDAFVPHTWLARGLFTAGLLVELAVPLALLGAESRAAVGVCLIALHQANARLLLLPFPTYQLLVFCYLVNPSQLFR